MTLTTRRRFAVVALLVLLAALVFAAYLLASRGSTPEAYHACQAIYTYPLGPYGPRVFVSPWHPPYPCVFV